MCDKKAYDSYNEAKEALKCIKRSAKKRSKIPTRAYRCEECGQYHLTSISHPNKRKLKNKRNNSFECKKKKNKDFVIIKNNS